jgi:hypothetical protein
VSREVNVVVILFREVSGSNHGQETGCPDRLFAFFLVPPGNYWDNTLKLGNDHFLSNPFQMIIHLSFYHSTL